MIRSDGPGRLSTTQESQQHAEWPCVKHDPAVGCQDAIASFATKQGARVIRVDQEQTHP